MSLPPITVLPLDANNPVRVKGGAKVKTELFATPDGYRTVTLHIYEVGGEQRTYTLDAQDAHLLGIALAFAAVQSRR